MSRPTLIPFAGNDRPLRPRPFTTLRNQIERGQQRGLTLREIAKKHKYPLYAVQREVTLWLDEGRI